MGGGGEGMGRGWQCSAVLVYKCPLGKVLRPEIKTMKNWGRNNLPPQGSHIGKRT